MYNALKSLINQDENSDASAAYFKKFVEYPLQCITERQKLEHHTKLYFDSDQKDYRVMTPGTGKIGQRSNGRNPTIFLSFKCYLKTINCPSLYTLSDNCTYM